jgi:hypothetical protein
MLRVAVALVIMTAAAVVVTPSVTFAQSGISGVVKDTSGGVLPGVTVEAASPALIEGARRAVTDGSGLYTLLDLRPGVYVVTFTLQSFATVVREGIELPAAFTATVNAELRPGALEETITVSGVSPTVDVRNVLQRSVMPRELTDNLPSTRSPQAFVKFTPGMTSASLGTIAGDRNELNLAMHGSRAAESQIRIDGDQAVMISGQGALYQAMRFNQAYVQEMSVVVGAGSAEQENSGVTANIIPREGGNTFSGSLYAGYSGRHLVATNLSDEVRAAGLTTVSGLVRFWDVTPSLGGPIIRNKLWFFSAYRNARSVQTRDGLYEDQSLTDWVYTPDPTRPSTDTIYLPDVNSRLTWQIADKHKLSVFVQRNGYAQQNRNSDQLLATEATGVTSQIPNIFAQTVWKSPASNRLFLEAGFSSYLYNRDLRSQPTADIYSVATRDVGGVLPGIWFNAIPPTDPWSRWKNFNFDYKANASYLTGSQAFKVGVTLRTGWDRYLAYSNVHDYAFTVSSGVPIGLTLMATPFEHEHAVNANLGLFVQDQWTVDRVTLNLGLRYDYLNATARATNLPAVQWAPARVFPAVDDTPNWHDVSPRMGVAYDLFGDSRTAIKASLGRYVYTEGTGLATANHPVVRSVLTTDRSWTDRDGDFVPDCVLTNPDQDGECGPMSNRSFGRNNPQTTTYADNVLHGFGVRPYDWTASVELQRELLQNVSVTAGYYWRRAFNFQATRNQLVTPSDYDPYCITAPVDRRLPDGGGYQVCGLYDIKPAQYGQVLNQVVRADQYGKRTEAYDGFDVTANARLVNGARLAGGLNMGRVATNSCFVVNSPQELLNCAVTPPLQPNFKLYGVYPLPWAGLQVSATLQVVPGPQITASYLMTNAQVQPSLGRPLGAGAAGTVTVPLVAPGTLYADGGRQLDVRFSKRFTLGRTRLNANVDLLNIINASAVQALSSTYGVAWQRPSQIQGPRTAQLSAQLSF